MDEQLSFLGLRLYPYGLCVAAGALMALALAWALLRKRGASDTAIGVFSLLCVPLGVIGARALYCAVNYNYFVSVCEDPALMLNFFDGGLSVYGALAGIALAAWLGCRAGGARLADMLDALCAPAALWIALARFGERFTELGVGKVVEQNAVTAAAPWLFFAQRAGKNVEYRLAVSQYEAAVALIILAVMLWLFFSKARGLKAGDLCLLFVSLYGATQTMLESMRDDGHMLIIFLRVGQLIAALMPVLASALLMKRYRLAVGRLDRRSVIGKAVLVLCIGMLVFLEFSLDGRVTVGAGGRTRDYIIMLATCAALFAVPCSLVRALAKRAGQTEEA